MQFDSNNITAATRGGKYNTVYTQHTSSMKRTPGTISAFPSSLHSATFALICSRTSVLISPVSPMERRHITFHTYNNLGLYENLMNHQYKYSKNVFFFPSHIMSHGLLWSHFPPTVSLMRLENINFVLPTSCRPEESKFSDMVAPSKLLDRLDGTASPQNKVKWLCYHNC
jgi:hypothetical protein